MTIHDATAELARRAENKARKAKGLKAKPFPQGADPTLFGASRADLLAMTTPEPEFVAAPSEVFATPEPAPAPAKVTTKAKASPEPKPLTRFQTVVNSNADKYGEGFGSRRKARGLAPLTAEQRQARKDLYALLESTGQA
jgi:hypothetical protein